MAEIVVLADLDAVAREAAERWVKASQEAVQERGTFSIALSGGETPRRLYALMASSPWKDQVPWEKTYVFWGDERRVPVSSPESNYRMAYETLLSHVPIPPEQIFRMDGESLSSRATRDYDDLLYRYFHFGRREWPRFDLVLLGLGLDGHTASIFPGTRAASDLSNRVIVYPVPQIKGERITLTLPVLNNARQILFMVSGEAKAEVLREVLHGERRASTYPAQAVQPVDGTLTWLVDKDAAAQLPE